MVAHRGDAALDACAGGRARALGRSGGALGPPAAGRGADLSSTAPEESLEPLGVRHRAGAVVVVEVHIPGVTAGKVSQAVDP